MVSDEQVTGDRWITRRREGVGGRRRWWAGSQAAAAAAAATPLVEWKQRGGDTVGGAVEAVSARKLAASLWHLAATTNGGGGVRWQCGLSFDRLGFEFRSSVSVPKFAMEGVTKWDYCNYSKAWDNVSYFQSNVKLTSVASGRQAELFKARKRINESDVEGGWSRTRMKYCMKKFNEKTASGMRTEHQKLCLVIKNLADGVRRERKICKRIDMMNSKLLRDIAEARLSAKRFVQNLEKEKKARAELEDLCNNLAKEIEGNKAEIGAFRNQRNRIQLEVEEERKMLQMAEVWREEQAQMKLADAKLILEDKHAEISNLIPDLNVFLKRLNLTRDVKMMNKGKVLRQAFASVNIQGIKDFRSAIPESDQLFTKDPQTSEAERRSADHCHSYDQAHHASIFHHINPEVYYATRKSLWSNGLTSGGSGFKDTIGIETVTQAEICSSRTPGESEGSVNKIRGRTYMSNCNTEPKKNAHHGSQKSEASEFSSVTLMQSKKKASSACKIQRAVSTNKDKCKTIMIDGSSNRSISSIVSMASPQRVSGEGALAVQRNPHVVRAMKGHIERPRGIKRHGLAANLLEARLESQKMLLRNVLKQRS